MVGPRHLIYLVPSASEIQLTLTREENRYQAGLRGVAAWLASGLKIEEQW